MSTVVIRAKNICKEYRLGTISHGTLSKDLQSWWANFRGKEDPNARIDARISGKLKSSNNHFCALWDVSFDIESGEVIGIIGRNGAGKSTLLKILSRVTAPTKGRIRIKGRVASLLEVGTGFHPELTGQENIFLNGAILGMHKGEIEDKFDEIVKFSDIEKFIDTPVKRYSSGMYVRLAFAVAAHLDSEILLVDEVLAVGDASFQKKCFTKMNSVSHEGRTILLVSHNMAAIQNISQRTILLQAGKKIFDGIPQEAISYYLSEGIESAPNRVSYPESDLPGNNEVHLKEVRWYNGNGSGSSSVSISDDIFIEMTFLVTKNITNYHNYLRVSTESGLLLFGSGDWDDENTPRETMFSPGTYTSVCRIPGNLLNRGTFFLSILGQIPHKRYLFVEENILKFHVNELAGAGGAYSASRPGVLRPKLNWQTKKI